MKNLHDLKNFDAIKIYLASSDEIKSWSNGEVTKPETINYRTFKPERDGLFDERIFGPVKNFECYCGKYKGVRYKGVICDKCGVEITYSKIRRERMGHITLATPVAHVWFFRGIPSKLALILDISPRNVESVIYFSSFIVTDIEYNKKAEAISNVDKDLEVAKQNLQKKLDKQVEEIEAQADELATKKGDLKAQEEALKIRQKVQGIRNSYEKQEEELVREFKILQKKIEGIELYSVLTDNEYLNLRDYLDIFCELEIGAEALEKILKSLDLNELATELREELERSKGQKATKISKRLKVVEQFRRAEIDPSRMIMDIIPVIPPDLRPLVQLEGGRFASSDLNELYRRLINRNNRLKRLLDLGAPEIIIRNEKRMLQESVDALFDSSKQRQKSINSKGKKELRSLADMIKGKTGIFRLNLLGKRVDYSGRAVITNGPTLRLDECGLPKEMALELFKPFVLREILSRGFAPNIKSAKYFLETRATEVWDILEEVVQNHPVLLNRAPTLWRLGIQAFYPKLIEGNSIRLHLCVCSGFNADFDGDQMAVHVPLGEAAIKEAREVMISTNNLLNPSSGAPMSVPSKSILFGIYYMTSVDTTLPVFDKTFTSFEEVLYLHNATNLLKLKQLVKLKYNGEIIETTPGRILFNLALPENYRFVNKDMDKGAVNAILSRAFEEKSDDVVVTLIDSLKDIGLEHGTMSGHSISLEDVQVPDSRESIIEKGRQSVLEIEKNFKKGLITRPEAQRLTEDAWNHVTSEVDEAVWQNLNEDNPVKILLKSKSTRASRVQITQLAGVRGLVADPTGKLVTMPILGNYKMGLSGLEYFVGARGARKGLVDKGLKTADAGYLTRRLVDVSQDVLIRENDCETTEGREMFINEKTILQSFGDRIVGRYVASDFKVGNKIIIKGGTLITRELADQVEKSGEHSIFVRSPLTCKTRRGLCAKCYGLDLITRKEVRLGTAVGVAAAQSIGEPGTQLTMQTFHTGGVAGKDITQGLPRVEELVEARAPKYLSLMSEITGTVKLIKNGDERKIIVTAADASEDVTSVEYLVDPVSEILVKDNELVAKGQKLTAGHLDLTDLQRTVGVNETKKYIIDEIQKVYGSQGVTLNDKHIEIIVRQMFNNVRIEEFGNSDFMEGEIATKAKFEEENEKVLAVGGTPATAKVTLLGITKASLYSDSFLSAASFQQTPAVLTDAAASGKVDWLLGLKENVIIGKLIPTGDEATTS